MNQINIDKYTISIPGEWNEFTQKQLLYIAEFIDVWQTLVTHKISLGKSKALLILELLNTTPQKIITASNPLLGLFVGKKQRAIANLIQFSSVDEWGAVLELINFVFTKNNLTKNIFPCIKINGLKFYGPNDACENLRFGEFVFAEEYFKAFVATGNFKYLNLMCAVLYRQPKEVYNPFSPDTDGDIREKFNRNTVDLRAKFTAKLSLPTQKAIMLFYAGFRGKMVDENPNIFPKQVETDSQNSNTKAANWADILLKMARTKNMDDEVLEQKLLSTILMELEQVAKEEQQMRKQYK